MSSIIFGVPLKAVYSRLVSNDSKANTLKVKILFFELLAYFLGSNGAFLGSTIFK